jgi:hypothetical protein
VLGIVALMRFAGFYVERSDLLAAMEQRRARNGAMFATGQNEFVAASSAGAGAAKSRVVIVDYFAYEDGRAMSCVNMAAQENHRRCA